MKIRTLITGLLAVGCITNTTSAQISANTDAQNNSIVISGTISNNDAQVVLVKPGFNISDAEDAAVSADKSELSNVVEYFGQVIAKDKNIQALIPMRDNAEKGKYLLVVGNEECSVYFATLKERLENMIPSAKIALSNGSFEQFAESDGKYFCNSTLYEALSNCQNVAKYASDILEEFKNADNSQFMSKMSSALNMGIIMQALNESKIDDFALIKSLTDNTGMILPSNKVDLIETDKVENVISAVSGKNFNSAEEYKKALSESIFINVINNDADMTNADKKSFFEMYAEKLGLNLVNYKQLTENKKTEAIAKLSAENTTSLQLMQSSLDTLCRSNTVVVTPGGGNGGGGGSTGKGGGGETVYSNTKVADNNPVPYTPIGFTDLYECEWARTAIEYLVSSKMINGYEDNTFRPLRNISRAEFISVLARKYLPLNSYTQSFKDVDVNSWYFNYVESAYSNGIISGTGDNIFAPNENISRQDMAIILHRLAGFSGKEISGSATEFADNSAIADYAKNAVYNLKSAGIVKGDENGNFNPNAAATRAEAVQMIYNFMKFLD